MKHMILYYNALYGALDRVTSTLDGSGCWKVSLIRIRQLVDMTFDKLVQTHFTFQKFEKYAGVVFGL